LFTSPDTLSIICDIWTGNHLDKFDIQDRAIDSFRKFATSRKVHITLVVHPRKVNSSLIKGGLNPFGCTSCNEWMDGWMNEMNRKRMVCHWD
jgi:hypothetical protein